MTININLDNTTTAGKCALLSTKPEAQLADAVCVDLRSCLGGNEGVVGSLRKAIDRAYQLADEVIF